MRKHKFVKEFTTPLEDEPEIVIQITPGIEVPEWPQRKEEPAIPLPVEPPLKQPVRGNSTIPG